MSTERSSEIAELATALSNAQAEFVAIPKGSENPFFKSKYAGLPQVVQVASPILTKHGLAISQFIGADDHGDTLTTLLLHKSGQFLSESMRLHLTKNDAQGQGSATTYARRYSYMAVLGLVADDDDDGNKAAGRQAKNEPPYGPALNPTFEKVTKAAVVQLAGGDTDAGKKLWQDIAKELGGYVPQGVALALIRVAEATINSVPFVEAPEVSG